jgi:chemotaxis signal transduction protein
MNAAETAARHSFVLLQIGNRRFALPADAVMELAPPVRLHSFPHTSPLVAGVIVRRGRIVPVYDAASALGAGASSGQRFFLLARRPVGKRGEPCAIPVNGQCELATCEMRPPEAGRPAYIVGTVAMGEESLDVLDLLALIAPHSSGSGVSPNLETHS